MSYVELLPMVDRDALQRLRELAEGPEHTWNYDAGDDLNEAIVLLYAMCKRQVGLTDTHYDTSFPGVRTYLADVLSALEEAIFEAHHLVLAVRDRKDRASHDTRT